MSTTTIQYSSKGPLQPTDLPLQKCRYKALSVHRATKRLQTNHTQIKALKDRVSYVVVELAKKNGGMIYRKAGTTTNDSLLARVCPGLGKESLVSSSRSGGIKHGMLRQQTPYVVQERGNLTLTTQGEWLNLNLKENASKKVFAHIPLEVYEFKGW